MIPFPWQIGLLALLVSSLVGVISGILLGALFSAALRLRYRPVLDGLAGAVGFLGAYWLSIGSGYSRVEANRATVGWHSGTFLPGPRQWLFEHQFMVSLVACVFAVAVFRVCAVAADRLLVGRPAR